MTQRPFLACLAVFVLLTAGCLHSKKPAASKDNTSLTGETEQTFMQRWIDKRAAELVAQGQTTDAARTQATAEFRERFGYTGAAQK
jgi:hypothetical protein